MNLTILIPTSPIPLHPSTAILDETIFNIRQYTEERIIILFDGVHHSLQHRAKDYESYKRAVIENIEAQKYGYATYIEFDEHSHQAKMTRYAMTYFVDTPLVMFCEHDTSPIGEIPFNEICQLVQNDKTVNYMRFNIFHMILPEHRYLMLGEEWATNPNETVIKYTRTIQWSQRPHIAKSDWYREILENHFGKEQRTMIEDVMHSVVQDAYHRDGKDFGLTIYTPDGNQLRSYHSDARGTDTKIIEG